MSTTYEQLDKNCPRCDQPLMRVHVKSPFIDDFQDYCNSLVCDERPHALRRLNASERAEARREAANG